jgi:two-component system, cell cycle sensor histidine kinase and response regulator CckA
MFRSLVENISEIVIVIDPVGVVRYVNPRLQKVLGLRAEDAIGQNIFDFIHPDDAGRARLEYSETIRKAGEGVPSLLRVRDANGAWIPFEIIANNRLNDPDIQGIVFTARDLRFREEVENTIRLANADVEKQVEERTIELAKTNAALRLENQSHRETERRLQETISLLNATLNSTDDGILVVGRDRKVSGCNRRFVEMWHLQCDSAVGLEDTELLSIVVHQLQDPNEFITKVNALYSDWAATSFDILSFKDGRIYERYSQPQRLEDYIVGRVWSFRDVTGAKRLEEDLQQSQKLEALGRLAGGVAHDFNNLLMLISGYLGRLSVTALLPEQQEASELALEATKRAAALTRQLLAFGRKQPDAPRVTNLNEVVSNMQGMLRSLVAQSIRLDISLNDDPVPIFADFAQLEVVLMNLAINARDAMPNGGVLSVVGGRQDRDSGTLAVLTVTDSGKGMTSAVRARAFEPFFTTKEIGKGTGLGLSTVYGIVKRAGGHIEVDSEPNQGTQFRIYLPETRKAADAGAPVATPPPPAGGHETILLAEDEVGIRAMTRAYLEGLGYHVLEAADGLEAIKISRKYHGSIDLVLTDLLMPTMRGDAMVESIREHRPAIKALYISGSLEDLGADEHSDVLPKPFEFPELGRRLRMVVESDLKLPKPA